ncbi:MAG: AAA family ATPase [Clostridia bacterium]|nr:AAA family ATPase [Clostridia bacterium]
MFAEQGCYTDSLSQIIDYDNIIPQDLFVVLENNCHGFECAGQVCSNAMDFINKTYAMTGNSTPNMTFKELFKQVTKMWPRQAMKATLEFDSFFSGNSQSEGASDSLRIKSVATQNAKEEEEEFVPIKLESGSFDDYKSKIISLIDNNVKQIIFTGAPGTGKTFLAKEVSKTYGKKEDVKCINGGNYQLVQFHTSFDYTDFVEGLRPMESREKVVEFRKVDGIFKEFCRKVEEENIKDIYGLESRIGNQSSFEDLYLKYIKSIIKTSYDGDYCNLNEPKVNYELRMKLKDIVTDDSLRLIEKTT